MRIRKETLKAAYTAAEARLGIADLLDEVGDGSEDTAGDAASDAGDSGTDAGDAASDAGDAAEVDRSAAVRAKFNEVTEAIEREFGGPVGDLRELRPGALGSGGGDMRLLFTEEPAGTALLISVVEGGGSRDEAVRVSVDVLRRVRAGEDPEAGACQFADKESFLGAFFPDSAGDVDAGAGALAARNRGRSLADQRKRLGLTQTEVAERMRVPTERVAAIERAEPGATEVGALASYVSALGGYLEIIADFGDERVVVR